MPTGEAQGKLLSLSTWEIAAPVLRMRRGSGATCLRDSGNWNVLEMWQLMFRHRLTNVGSHIHRQQVCIVLGIGASKWHARA